MPNVGGSSSGADSGYSTLVPNLESMEDFLEEILQVRSDLIRRDRPSRGHDLIRT